MGPVCQVTTNAPDQLIAGVCFPVEMPTIRLALPHSMWRNVGLRLGGARWLRSMRTLMLLWRGEVTSWAKTGKIVKLGFMTIPLVLCVCCWLSTVWQAV